jgi:ABC-type multidrug transport system fused ATPase/permease subunit
LNISVIKQQGKNYFGVLRWLLGDYHRKETKAFWLVQLLMALSVGLGLTWLLGVIAGINHLNDQNYLSGMGLAWLTDFFDAPVWQWMLLLSLAGVISAGALFASFHVGVQSIIRYQLQLVNRLLAHINDENNTNWLEVVKDQPREKLHRIIKLSVQLTGLVTRRLSRMLIPLLTFLVSFVALINLDAALLANLIPLAVLYLVALYFINRHAARVQVRLANISVPANRSLGILINDMLQRNRRFDRSVTTELAGSEYPEFSLLRYKRRLAEVHVVWLNTLFLVFGTAVIFFSFDHYQTNGRIDWMQLILFLVALRYAGSGLQEMAAATVSFSRFLPETELVCQVLNPDPAEQSDTPCVYQGRVMYFHSDVDHEVVMPALLKYNFGVKNSQKLTEEIRSGVCESIQDKEAFWIYTVNPLDFKQAVRNNRKLVDHVLYTHLGEHVHYTDIDQFLKDFKPVQVRQSMAMPQDDCDETLL